jgi:hypothetical protein
MGSPSRYWQLVKLDTTGHRQVEEVLSAKEFFQQQFSELTGQKEVPDALIQRQLWNLIQENEAGDHTTLAKLCLRCYISHIIDSVCRQLAYKFGRQHNFTANDLLPYVLDDEGVSRRPHSNEYQSLSSRILDSYDPDKAALSTWVYRRLIRHDALEPVLLEHGVFLRSDWSFLNADLSTQLRILRNFHALSDIEIAQAKVLLESYHAVYRASYRASRISEQPSGSSRRCQPPTSEQLHQIAQELQTDELLPSEVVLSQLQALAAQLRQYRIATKQGGAAPMASIEDHFSAVDRIPAPEQEEDADEQRELLRRYEELFMSCLDETIAQVIGDRFTTLPRKRTPAQFITALKLLYCQGLSMTSIATQLNLGAQSQVTRLLQLTELRADIRQRWLAALQERVPELVRSFDSLERLKDWDRRLEQALSEEVEAVLQEAVTETRSSRNCPLTSRFAQRLCYYLDSLDPDALGE